ncbi:MAG: HD domain-containing protein [Acidimicrobiia bacterium]
MEDQPDLLDEEPGAVMHETTTTDRGRFARMDESTREQWDQIATESVDDWANVPDRMLGMLRALSGITNGFAVDQLTHVCQTAARAERAGADKEVVAAALCHDIAKAVSEPNHPAVAAALLKPYVRPDVVWMVQVHQDFQGRHYYAYLGKDPDARLQYRDHPAYDLAERFADEWDQTSFDPEYDTPPLEHFEPLVREIFGAPRHF